MTQTLPVFLASVTGVHGLREGAWREEEAGAGDQLPGSELAGATWGADWLWWLGGDVIILQNTSVTVPHDLSS